MCESFVLFWIFTSFYAAVCGGGVELCMCLYTVFVLTVEACEAEHADLLCDVVPGARRPQSLELSFQLSPHQQHSVSHGLHIVLPGVKHTEKTISISENTLCYVVFFL